MYGYIYLVTNKINGRKYIGQHKYDKPELDPKYFGSGKILKQAIFKEGLDNFEIKLLECCNSKEELDIAEIKWISLTDATAKKDYYNIASGGGGRSSKGTLWYNDGENEYQFSVEDTIPKGLIKGRLYHSGGPKGHVWINNTKINKLIDSKNLDNYIQKGWTKGMLYRGDKWYDSVSTSLKHKSKETIQKIKEKRKEFFKDNPDFRNSGNFKKGCTSTIKGRISITDGTKNRFILPTEEIPCGWHRGQTQNHKRGK